MTERGKHREVANRVNTTKVVGFAGLSDVAVATALLSGLGAGTAEARPTHNTPIKPNTTTGSSNTVKQAAVTPINTCTNCTTTPPTSPIPTDINIPHYGYIPSQLPQSGLSQNPQTCPSSTGCYNPIATTPLPISGQTYPTGSFGSTATTTVTIPSTANETFPVVANSSGTSTTLQLPTFSFGGF